MITLLQHHQQSNIQQYHLIIGVAREVLCGAQDKQPLEYLTPQQPTYTAIRYTRLLRFCLRMFWVCCLSLVDLAFLLGNFASSGILPRLLCEGGDCRGTPSFRTIIYGQTTSLYYNRSQPRRLTMVSNKNELVPLFR